jgi:predicted AlkP superfamily phosphohydrolase/phosphomutase
MRGVGRLLVVGLDGFEISLAERLVAEGRMPHLARLQRESARFLLDHGVEKFTGLTWEHFSTGRTPHALDRHSAVCFDPSRYHVAQEPTHAPPVFAQFTSRCVLFDVPYCDLNRAPDAIGVARWGAHDPGAPASCRPESLLEEMTARFGAYPAEEFIYGLLWQSEAATRRAGQALAEAVRVRARAARWLLAERQPEWDLAVVVVSEPHSAIEPMWHGVDPEHPLHVLPSAAPAREAIEAVYVEVDRLIGMLVGAVPDARLMVFAMHGMGPNEADVPAMALLPELLYRRSFGEPYMLEVPWPDSLASGIPLLAEADNWHWVMEERVPKLDSESVKKVVSERRRGEEPLPIEPAEIDYQPASRYRPFWPEMDVFALPSFYDGRIRVNLVGRERHGTVPPDRYDDVVEEVKALLHECVDSTTGDPVVAGFHEPERPPAARGPTEADLQVFWRGVGVGLVHPTLGTVGPVPYRRTGGHSGAHGFLYSRGCGIPQGDHGIVSSFDVLPTIAAALGEDVDTLGVCGSPIRVDSSLASVAPPG